MHYSEIRIFNILEGLRPSCDESALEVGVEVVPYVNSGIVGTQLLQGGGDPVLGQGHESRDPNNVGRESVIYRG